ncbi:MAG: type II toxin-antitoxin system ParD family antitoxin [Sphingomonadales bacterium]|nr:type II toxin-antitoxin system ParD family antitoxin [Sphingomonadales bacterium]
MSQLNVSLPPALKAWVESRVAEGRFSSASDYVRHLLRRDQDEAADETEWLRKLIAESRDSEIIEKEPEDILEEIVAERNKRYG